MVERMLIRLRMLLSPELKMSSEYRVCSVSKKPDLMLEFMQIKYLMSYY